jgi:DNA-binding XRE family transcriptional regulator
LFFITNLLKNLLRQHTPTPNRPDTIRPGLAIETGEKFHALLNITLNIELSINIPYSIFRVKRMEPETEQILEKIHQKRLEKKVSLLKLANEVEISHSHLYYIEIKRVMPSIEVVIKLAKALGLTFQDFCNKDT